MLYRYKSFEEGGVFEFFQKYGVSLRNEPSRKIKKLLRDLTKCLIHSPEGDFVCSFGNNRYQFEGADEMGTLYSFLNDICSVAPFNSRQKGGEKDGLN